MKTRANHGTEIKGNCTVMGNKQRQSKEIWAFRCENVVKFQSKEGSAVVSLLFSDQMRHEIPMNERQRPQQAGLSFLSDGDSMTS